MTAALHFENVSHDFGERAVISQLNLCLKAGEVVTIVGPSGTGKTTLLRLAAGLIKPKTGLVTCRASKIGMTFQAPRLLPWRSALKNIMIPLENEGVSKNDAESRARYYLDKLGLAAAAEAWPGQLSGGMAHRVSLARTLAIQPDLLLLDEPMTGLDQHTKEQTLDLLQEELNRRSISCLYVTHYAKETSAFSNRSLQLNLD